MSRPFKLTALVAILLVEPLCGLQAGAQLVAITSNNAAEIASHIWDLNSARDPQQFYLDELDDFLNQYRGLVSYAAPDTTVELACPFAGHVDLRGTVGEEVAAGERIFADFKDCTIRDFLRNTSSQNGSRSFVFPSVDDGLVLDVTDDYTNVVESELLPQPIRASFSGTFRYAIRSGSVVKTTDRHTIRGSTPAGETIRDLRAFSSSLALASRGGGVLDFTKSFEGRFEYTPIGGAVIVRTYAPLTGSGEELPSDGGFSAEGAAGSKVFVEPTGPYVFLFVDADGDGFDDDNIPNIILWPTFVNLATQSLP
jgi:hypothetical protein